MQRPAHVLPGLAAAALLAAAAAAAGAAPASLPGGEFTPVVAPGPDQKTVRLAPFALDVTPVTNGDYLAFVTLHPEWRRGSVPSLKADSQYLAHWQGPLTPGEGARAEQPVTHVSWFAARAYCAAHAGRLPTWYEWEYAAAADETRGDARADPAFRERILAWYAVPSGRPLPAVGQGPANVYGLRDLHGLVWEWVEDFGGLMVSGDSRNQGDPDKLQFCGAGALAAESREDYPVLMRMALLSSLEASYTTANLGFRCAYGDPP
ncbi:MAG: formylglycine-generating enzyme family protein [Proteobacteria bacterium]|nr:formylglycine-generating enzyme family protein [Pseudomonadota bacterium]